MSKVDLNTFAIATLFASNTLTLIYPISGIVVFLVILSLILSIFVNNIYLFFNNGKILIFSLILVFIFIIQISFTFGNNFLSNYFFNFLIFGVSGIVYSQLEFSKELLYKTMSAFGLILIPTVATYNFGDRLSDSIDYGNWMGVSYDVLRIMIPILILCFFSKKWIFKILFLCALIFYINIQLNYGSRGAILSFLLFYFSFILIKSKNLKLTFMLSFIFIALLLIAIFVYFFQSIENLFFMSKIVDADSGDISNGRYDIYNRALDGVLSSPIYGNGIASYEKLYNNGYVHNIFIQVGYEFGLFGIFILIYLLIKPIYYWRFISRPEAIFLMFLICSGFIQLIFSSFYWGSQYFWFLFGYLLTNRFLKKASCSMSAAS
ncbi:O-antigen ligase family protein [Acinetobacter sp. ANC 5584]